MRVIIKKKMALSSIVSKQELIAQSALGMLGMTLDT